MKAEIPEKGVTRAGEGTITVGQVFNAASSFKKFET